MITKFDVGDTVFIVGVVSKIEITKKSIKYTVVNVARQTVADYDESELMLKKKCEEKSDGTETR